MKAIVKKGESITVSKDEGDNHIISIEADRMIFLFSPTKAELESLKLEIDQILKSWT